MSTDPKFELLQFLQVDAADLIAARHRSQLIHRTSDIRSSGDEVEISARAFLKRRLSLQHYVGHGHVVDSAGNVSSQHDVIIADGTNTPVLFRGRDGAEYFPYESVFAIGEVKSTYYAAKKPIEAFVEATDRLRSELSREQTPKEYIGEGMSLAPAMKSNSPRPYRNPLFTFMLFVDAGDFTFEDVRALYERTAVSHLPSVVCLLGKGNIVYLVHDIPPSPTHNLQPVPEFAEYLMPNGERNWYLLEPALDMIEGSSLGILYALLSTHLIDCKLVPPLPIRYFSKAIAPYRFTPVSPIHP